VLPAGLPSLLALPLYVIVAAAGGGVVGAVPGLLKARFGAHEVITTIMLNFVVLALLAYFVSTYLHVPETLHTEEIRTGALPRLADFIQGFHGSAANATILLAIAAAVLSWWLLFRTRPGFELRAAGLQPEAAEYGGVNVGGVWLRAMTISGALAGVGGLNYVLGYKHYYEEGFAAGSGFLGIAVALVGRSHPGGIILAALLFATLSQGGLAVNALVPKQMVEVLQAVVILAVATSVPEVERLLRSMRRSSDRAPERGEQAGGALPVPEQRPTGGAV
jgi:simple sugar transport system permease protein